MPRPELSVVIPTFNRIDRIKRVLEALAGQDYPRDAFEVVIVSDGSTDGTNEYLSSLSLPCHLQFVLQSNQGPAAARNVGISKARGKFIVFIDDDVVPDARLLSEHMRMHSEANRDIAVIGPLLTPKEFKLSPWVQWEQVMLVKQYDAMIREDWKPTARQFYTGNASVRRAVLLEVGGFDEQFRRAEDVELAYRLADRGIEFVFSMAAAGLHYAERSFHSWFEAAYAYGRNDAIFARDQQRSGLIPLIRAEFGRRKLPLRLLVRACLDRPHLSSAVATAMRGLAEVAGRLASSRLEAAAYSGLFVLRYYQGFSDELGEAEPFLQRTAPKS